MSSWFIGQEDWEGDNGDNVATEDNANANAIAVADANADADADANAEAGEYACDFLKVALCRL